MCDGHAGTRAQRISEDPELVTWAALSPGPGRASVGAPVLRLGLTTGRKKELAAREDLDGASAFNFSATDVTRAPRLRLAGAHACGQWRSCGQPGSRGVADPAEPRTA
jgi:hypothetical protein